MFTTCTDKPSSPPIQCLCLQYKHNQAKLALLSLPTKKKKQQPYNNDPDLPRANNLPSQHLKKQKAVHPPSFHHLQFFKDTSLIHSPAHHSTYTYTYTYIFSPLPSPLLHFLPPPPFPFPLVLHSFSSSHIFFFCWQIRM